MYMKDITFCINKECKERKDCFRAEENYTNTNSVNSYAMFECDSCDESSLELLNATLLKRKI